MKMSQTSAKRLKCRKVDKEGRVFQDQWTYDYLFVSVNKKPTCLVCEKTIAVNKKINVMRHFDAKHASLYSSYTGQARLDTIELLKQNFGCTIDLPGIGINIPKIRVKGGRKKKKEVKLRFQEKWTRDYLFINSNGKPLCLVCGDILTIPRKRNIERHYISRHSANYCWIDDEQRRQEVEFLLKRYNDDCDYQDPSILVTALKKDGSSNSSSTFQHAWTYNYLFIDAGDKPMCLVCGEYVSVKKKTNVERHYLARHADQYDSLIGHARSEMVECLKNNIDIRQNLLSNLLSKKSDDLGRVVQASLSLNELIIKKKNPAFDSNFIRTCLITAGSILCPEKKDLLETLTLSLATDSELHEDGATSNFPILSNDDQANCDITRGTPFSSVNISNGLDSNDENITEVDADQIMEGGQPCEIIILDAYTTKSLNNNYASKRQDYLPWEDYFMAVAFLSGMRSKDPCSQVGACIVNEDSKIVAIGYNGMPKGCNDDDLPWGKDVEDRINSKHMYVCHAEVNAVMNKNSADVAHCRMYVALFPCNECAKVIIQSRIKEVIYYSDKHKHKQETIASKILLDMAGISYRQALLKSQEVHLDFSVVDEKRRGVRKESVKAESMVDVTINVDLKIDVNGKRSNFISWEEYFMALAFLSAQRSKDPSTQVGACIVNESNRIVGIGYNGMPIGCSDDLLPWNKSADTRLDTKYLYVCHAEMNAILNKNCPEVTECRIFVALFPCNECAKFIIQSGIREVVYFSDKYHDTPEVIASKRMLDLAKIKCREYNGKRHKFAINFDTIN